jgi:peptidoglycan/LPS O-acetylase OafA/YrhL
LLRPAGCLTTPLEQGREEFLDAARGAAMLFVLLSHFGTAYFSRGEADRFWEAVLIRVGMIASPTFTIVSGLVLGYLLSTTGRGSVRSG